MVFPFISVLFAQTAGSENTGFQVVDWITRIGVTGVLAYMWWLEHKERLASQERERTSHAREAAMLERMMPILTEATSALERVQTSMQHVQENLTEQVTPTRVPQLQSLVESMDALTDQLRARRPRGG